MSSLREETKTRSYLLGCYLFYSFGWGVVFGLILGILEGFIIINEKCVYTFISGIITGFLIIGPIMALFSSPKIFRYEYHSFSKNEILNQIQSKNFILVTPQQNHFLLIYRGFTYYRLKIVLEFSDHFFMLYAPTRLVSAFEKSFNWRKA